MDELSIKIKICDRVYPMKTSKKDEAILREAAKKINEKVDEYSDRFNTNDYQDLLSISCFDFLVELMKLKEKYSSNQQEIHEKITDLNIKAQDALKTFN